MGTSGENKNDLINKEGGCFSDFKLSDDAEWRMGASVLCGDDVGEESVIVWNGSTPGELDNGVENSA